MPKRDLGEMKVDERGKRKLKRYSLSVRELRRPIRASRRGSLVALLSHPWYLTARVRKATIRFLRFQCLHSREFCANSKPRFPQSFLLLRRNEPDNEDFFFKYNCIVPLGFFPVENTGCFPLGKLAATESRYPTYGACWVF